MARIQTGIAVLAAHSLELLGIDQIGQIYL